MVGLFHVFRAPICVDQGVGTFFTETSKVIMIPISGFSRVRNYISGSTLSIG